LGLAKFWNFTKQILKWYQSKTGKFTTNVLEFGLPKFWAWDHPHSGSRVPPNFWKKQRVFEGVTGRV
jgi:hypothetical protein